MSSSSPQPVFGPQPAPAPPTRPSGRAPDTPKQFPCQRCIDVGREDRCTPAFSTRSLKCKRCYDQGLSPCKVSDTPRGNPPASSSSIRGGQPWLESDRRLAVIKKKVDRLAAMISHITDPQLKGMLTESVNDVIGSFPTQ